MLFLKLLRDMRLYRVQFISIFLLSFMALFIYSGLGSESEGYEATLDKYYSETNMADIFLYGNSFSDENEEDIERVNGVADAERRLTVPSTAELSGSPNLTLYFTDSNDICKTCLVSGKDYARGASGIWLDVNFAKARDLSVGDEITVSAMGMSITQTIKGLILSPEYVYKESETLIPDHFRDGFAFLSINALPEGAPRIFNQLLVKLNEGASAEDIRLENALYDAVSDISILVTRDETASDAVFRSEIEERKAMTSVFPIAFVAIVALTLLTTMTRLVANQRIQIGTLKALGFSRARITRHFTLYSLLLTFTGGALGAAVGPLALPRLFYPIMKTTFTLPEWKPRFLMSTLIVFVLLVAASVTITFLCCRGILKQVPAETLRAPAPKSVKAGVLERSAFWQRRSFSFQWNLRDVLRSKGRSLVTIAGIMGCMGLLITGFGGLDAFNGLLDTKYDKIALYDYCCTLEEGITAKQREDILSETDGMEAMISVAEIKSDTKKLSTQLRIQDPSPLYQFLNMQLEPQTLPEGGISLSLKTAEKLGVKVGDTVKWHLLGNSEWQTDTVAGIYRDPTEQGAVISKVAYSEDGLIFTPTNIYCNSSNPSHLSGVKSAEEIAKSKQAILDMLATMYMLIAVLCVAAALLAVVVLYNLGVLSFTEKERELATMKVLGFQSGAIRRLLLNQNIWLSIIALVPGYYFGVLLLQIIFANMGNEFDMSLTVEPISVVICALFTMLLSVVVNYLFSGRIKKLNMVEALKSTE